MEHLRINNNHSINSNNHSINNRMHLHRSMPQQPQCQHRCQAARQQQQHPVWLRPLLQSMYHYRKPLLSLKLQLLKVHSRECLRARLTQMQANHESRFSRTVEVISHKQFTRSCYAFASLVP